MRSYSLPLPDGRVLDLGARTLIVGILNVTPDSFAGGYVDVAEAVEAGARLVAEGADLLDVGGESTRPGALPVDEEVERRRVVPVLSRLSSTVSVPLSVDTTKGSVAAAALDAGAAIVNDVSGLRADGAALGRVVAERHAALVLMHMRGTPADMYARAVYTDVVGEVAAELAERMAFAIRLGVDVDRIIIDPGIGFAKRAEHSFQLLANLSAPALVGLNRPMLVGPSRKSFLTAVLGQVPPAERDWGTAGAVAAAVLGGAHLVRVHDVAAMAQVVRVADKIRGLDPAP